MELTVISESFYDIALKKLKKQLRELSQFLRFTRKLFHFFFL